MGWVHWIGRNWDSVLNEKGRSKITKYKKLKLRYIVTFLKKDFLYLFLERGREREREEDKRQFVVAS